VVPLWEDPVPPPNWPPIVAEFAAFRLKHAGVAGSTVKTELPHIATFLAFVLQRRGTLGELRLEDIDEFVTAASARWGKKTVARLCTSLRSFTRFLHLQGHLAVDLASQVGQPRSVAAERPPRALPWPDVQRLLSAVDRGQRSGRRDYALLLLMASYGMGAAEVLHLALDDIDWRAGTIQTYRPKTGVTFLLPLLPAVAAALADYLRDARPRHVATRKIFVTVSEPHGPMSGGAIRHLVRTHARAAGITAKTLGAHVLRHSHACRQVELGASLKAIGDILGHRDPASTSTYTRVAADRLREMALPVPRWP
jgi:site-specific recombinase XerD